MTSKVNPRTPEKINPRPEAVCGVKRTKRSTEELVLYCKKAAGWGTDHLGFGACKWHGGRLPSVNRKAELDRSEWEMTTFFEQYHKGQVEDVASELSTVLADVVAFKDAVAGRLATIAGHHEIEDILEDPKLRNLLKLYERTLDRSSRLLAEATKLGILNRSLTLEERQAEAVQRAVMGALAKCGYGDDQKLLLAIGQELLQVDATSTRIAPTKRELKRELLKSNDISHDPDSATL
jgi:hypothetical protein